MKLKSVGDGENVELETSGKQQNDVPALEAIKGNSLKSDGS